ncbi:hypothetical protein D3C71_2160630 [compost metagenome]
MRQGVRQIIDEVIANGGSYYLPYIAYPTLEQFQAVYPGYDRFFVLKQQYDPSGLFMNQFYYQYGLGRLEEE